MEAHIPPAEIVSSCSSTRFVNILFQELNAITVFMDLNDFAE